MTEYLRGHTLLRNVLLALAAGAALFALTFVLSPFRNFELATVFAYLCATAGLTVLIGQTGQLSLGHGAMMATGAYTCALVANRLGDGGTTGPTLLLVPLVGAVVVTSLVGVVIGLAAARLSGPYLAGLTLALTIAVPAITTTFADRLGGDQGLPVFVEPAPLALGPTFPLEQWQAWISGVGALLTMLLLANLTHGRFGRAMRAVREDEVGARLAGIDVARTKVLAFVVSAATAGLGGALIAVETQAVSPGAYGLELSLFLVVAVVVGGLGHLAGAVWGALLLVALPELADSLADNLPVSASLAERLQGNLSLLVFGLVLVVVPILMPRGIHGIYASVAGRFRAARDTRSVPPAPFTEGRDDTPTKSSESIDV